MIVRIVRMNWLALVCPIVLASGMEARAQSSAATAAQTAAIGRQLPERDDGHGCHDDAGDVWVTHAKRD